ISNVFSELRQHDVKVKIYHPLPWRFWQWGSAINKEVFFNKLKFLISVANRRNHRKICIIDQNIHWLGSFNLSSVHLPTEMGGKGWRDSAIRLTTSNKEALNAFNKAWQHRYFIIHQTPANFTTLFRINDNWRKRRYLRKDLLSRIIRSDQRIWITTPYFIPEPKLLRKLKKAALRGVDVRILLPSVSDVFFMPWASSILYSELIKAGARIFEYKAGVLHAKTLMIDDWATIGSSNMNSRSLFHDLEIDYVIQNIESVQSIEKQYLDDINHSNEICLADIRKRNPIIKVFGRLVLYLRYWL
ncbi:MAG: cardiolipin synthase B, partial [Gammaproteobacteria bacterium]|nr:cardiolipin synthase B [Gammaproteobacteria bacterium]